MFNNRGNAYLREGEYDLAIRDYNQTISLNPDHGLAFNNRGNVARDRELRRQRERQCEAYFYLGEYFLLQGQRGQAIGLFRAALQTGSPALFEYVSAQAELKRLY